MNVRVIDKNVLVPSKGDNIGKQKVKKKDEERHGKMLMHKRCSKLNLMERYLYVNLCIATEESSNYNKLYDIIRFIDTFLRDHLVYEHVNKKLITYNDMRIIHTRTKDALIDLSMSNAVNQPLQDMFVDVPDSTHSSVVMKVMDLFNDLGIDRCAACNHKLNLCMG